MLYSQEVVVGYGHFLVKSTQAIAIFDGKSLFEMTVDRNRAIADTILVVGNIDNCHLSKQVLEKSNFISISLSLHQNTAAAIALPLLHQPDDI
jgi:mannose-1-phosphate guanylyltransferase